MDDFMSNRGDKRKLSFLADIDQYFLELPGSEWLSFIQKNNGVVKVG